MKKTFFSISALLLASCSTPAYAADPVRLAPPAYVHVAPECKPTLFGGCVRYLYDNEGQSADTAMPSRPSVSTSRESTRTSTGTPTPGIPSEPEQPEPETPTVPDKPSKPGKDKGHKDKGHKDKGGKQGKQGGKSHGSNHGGHKNGHNR